MFNLACSNDPFETKSNSTLPPLRVNVPPAVDTCHWPPVAPAAVSAAPGGHGSR